MKAKTHINEDGYRVFDDSGKYVHRWVAKKKYGDNIDGKEIHHIDGDKTNNEKSNLILLEKEDHYYLTKYENRKKFIASIIVGLAVFYLIIINLLNYTSILNKEVSTSWARTSVYFILIIALELKYGFIDKWFIRRKKEENR